MPTSHIAVEVVLPPQPHALVLLEEVVDKRMSFREDVKDVAGRFTTDKRRR